MVHDPDTGITQTTDVLVDLNGLGSDTTLADLAGMLDAIEGISAAVTSDGELTISSDSSGQELAFGGDTSGVLAALGLNTFFSGRNASSLGVSQVLQADPAKFAASRGGIATDTENAVELAAFSNRPIASQNDASVTTLYENMIGETAQASSVAQAVAEGAQTFENTLRGQKSALSGVNLDEEAVDMLALQQGYQAAARYISTLSDLMDVLVSL
jgi:flagellar hook-associated protein 1 FlgK